MQEGLSWTVIEAMYAGTPVICSDSTSHKELIEGTMNIGVPCEQEGYLPLITQFGRSTVETKSCSTTDIYMAMRSVVKEPALRAAMSKTGKEKILEWAKGCSNINDFISQSIN